MSKVSLTLKVDEAMKSLMKACAKAGRRTLSAYVESLVEEDAKAKKIRVGDLATTEIPDFIDQSVWNDFVEYRASINRQTNDSVIRYWMPNILLAHNNGWDVNELIKNGIANGCTASFVFYNHITSSPNVKEIAVKTKLAPMEIEIEKEKLLSYEGLSGNNKDRFVDHNLMAEMIDMTFETDQPLEMSMISFMVQKFRKSNNKTKCNQWIRKLLETKNVFDDDGNFVAMDGFNSEWMSSGCVRSTPSTESF